MEVQTISLILGLVVGVIMYLTGAGGTVLAVPLLVFALHLSVLQASPVGLLAVMLAATTGAILGLKAGVVRYKAAGLMAMFGLISAPVGLWVSHRLPNTLLALIFASVLIFIAIRMFRQSNQNIDALGWEEFRAPPVCRLDTVHGKFSWTAPCATRLMMSGALAGLLSGLLGVGGGFIIVPALRAVSELDIKSIVATSLSTIALVSAGGVVMAVTRGAINWHIALPFAGAAMFGMLCGKLISHRISESIIQRSFAVFATLVAIELLIKQL